MTLELIARETGLGWLPMPTDAKAEDLAVVYTLPSVTAPGWEDHGQGYASKRLSGFESVTAHFEGAFVTLMIFRGAESVAAAPEASGFGLIVKMPA